MAKSQKPKRQSVSGPASQTGKTEPSQNAIRHGLRARAIVMPWEDPEEYRGLRDALFRQWRPAGDMECALVHRMAESQWKLLRCGLIEAQILTSLCDPDAPVGNRAAAFIGTGEEDDMQALEKLRRYENAIERALHRALRTLMEMQKMRQAWPAPHLDGADDDVAETMLGRSEIWLAAPVRAEPAPVDRFGDDGSFTVRRIVFDDDKIRAAIEKHGHEWVHRRMESHPEEFATDEDDPGLHDSGTGEPDHVSGESQGEAPHSAHLKHDSGFLPNEGPAAAEFPSGKERRTPAGPEKRRTAA
jgi:hypothetical protein